jgi:hypothetical protein
MLPFLVAEGTSRGGGDIPHSSIILLTIFSLLPHSVPLPGTVSRELTAWISRKKDQLADVLRHALDTSNNKYADIDEEDDFQVIVYFFK